MKICGIDPGLQCTGYAVLVADGPGTDLLEAGVVRPDKSGTLPAKLHELGTEVRDLLKEHRPDAVAVEQLYSHYAHPRTAILMGHARGAILAVAAELDLHVLDISATRVKRLLTGNGQASKSQVQNAVVSLLGLAERPEPADVADAIAVALAGLRDMASAKLRAAPARPARR